jgi:hypothetical protein
VGDDEDDDEGDNDEGDKEEDDDVVNTHASDAGGGDTDVEMGELVTAEDAYALTKVMGDQDRKVCVPNMFTYIGCSILSRFCLSKRNLIVRLMYALSSNERKKEHVNVDTSGLEDGHVCTVCEK